MGPQKSFGFTSTALLPAIFFVTPCTRPSTFVSWALIHHVDNCSHSIGPVHASTMSVSASDSPASPPASPPAMKEGNPGDTRSNSFEDKIAHAHYSPPWANTSIIGIAGSSGSGKTSLSHAIIRELNLPWVVILSMDSFYKPLTAEQSAAAFRNEYDFDSPDAIDFDCLVERLRSIKSGYAPSLLSFLPIRVADQLEGIKAISQCTHSRNMLG